MSWSSSLRDARRQLGDHRARVVDVVEVQSANQGVMVPKPALQRHGQVPDLRPVYFLPFDQLRQYQLELADQWRDNHNRDRAATGHRLRDRRAIIGGARDTPRAVAQSERSQAPKPAHSRCRHFGCRGRHGWITNEGSHPPSSGGTRKSRLLSPNGHCSCPRTGSSLTPRTPTTPPREAVAAAVRSRQRLPGATQTAPLARSYGQFGRIFRV